MAGHVGKICQVCNKEFDVYPSWNKRKFCSRVCADKGRHKTLFWLGKHRSEETVNKIKEKLTGIKVKWSKKRLINFREKVSGDKNIAWKGGVTPIRTNIRVSLEYEEWRKKVIERDLYICQNCGDVGGILQVHHIKSFSQICDENNIKTWEEALLCDELWNTKNGETLCLDCHHKTNNWGINIFNKNRKEMMYG